MFQKKMVLISVLLLLAVLLTACGPNTAQRATMTAMVVDLNNANSDLAKAKVQLTQASNDLADANSRLATAQMRVETLASELNDSNLRIVEMEATLTASSHPLFGKWIDEVGDTWDFKANNVMHAYASGKDYDTTWSVIDSNTITIDFGPILTKPGDPNANLTLTYTITGDRLTLKFANGNVVPLTRVK